MWEKENSTITQSHIHPDDVGKKKKIVLLPEINPNVELTWAKVMLMCINLNLPDKGVN
jgi:hypothetical protein